MLGLCALLVTSHLLLSLLLQVTLGGGDDSNWPDCYGGVSVTPPPGLAETAALVKAYNYKQIRERQFYQTDSFIRCSEFTVMQT